MWKTEGYYSIHLDVECLGADDAVVLGGKCDNRCGRHNRSGVWCCGVCRDTPGTHDYACTQKEESRKCQLEEITKLAMVDPPQVMLCFDTQVEGQEAIDSISAETLAGIASRVGSDSATLLGPVKSVTSKGRFDVMSFGGKRVGCYLCNTKAMQPRLWLTHAQTPQHLQKTRGRSPSPEVDFL